MTISNPRLIDTLILERARVRYLLELAGLKESDLDTAALIRHIDSARGDVERTLALMRDAGKVRKVRVV